MKRLSGIVLFCLGFSFSHLSGCGAGPKVRIYLSDPKNGGMEYYDERTGDQGFVLYSETDKFIALNQADAQALLNYCGLANTSN